MYLFTVLYLRRSFSFLSEMIRKVVFSSHLVVAVVIQEYEVRQNDLTIFDLTIPQFLSVNNELALLDCKLFISSSVLKSPSLSLCCDHLFEG